MKHMGTNELVGATFLLAERLCLRLGYPLMVNFTTGAVWVVDAATRRSKFKVLTEDEWLDALLLLIGKLKAEEDTVGRAS